jgi:hypothetical protein
VKDGVSAGARNQKLAQVSQDVRKRGLVFRALSVVVPGAGHIAEDMPFFGFVLLSVWLFGAIFLLAGGRLYPLLDPMLGLGSSLNVLLMVVVLLTVLIVANTVAQPRIRA